MITTMLVIIAILFTIVIIRNTDNNAIITIMTKFPIFTLHHVFSINPFGDELSAFRLPVSTPATSSSQCPVSGGCRRWSWINTGGYEKWNISS
jgi:hypothetical protein